MGGYTRDLTGMKFTRLTVLERGEPYITKDNQHLTRWVCRCDCGKVKTIRASELINNRTLSCGCLGREHRIKSNRRHGGSKTKIYHIYLGMIDRCYDNVNCYHYKNYGGRGISVCDEWRGENGFLNFKTWALKNGYDESLSLDRIDVNGNYEPSNCRFITMKQQQNNKRGNVNLTLDGETHTIAEWAEIVGIKYTTLKERVKRGWDAEKAIRTPTIMKFSHPYCKVKKDNVTY